MKDMTVKRGKATTVRDRSGKCFTKEREILNRWREYCTELYNHKANGDLSILDYPHTDTEDDHPILRKEVEATVQSLKKGKSAGVDNIPPTQWTRSLVITLPKEGNLQQCQNYRTISLISHPSTLMLKITLNRLKPQAEKIIA